MMIIIIMIMIITTIKITIILIMIIIILRNCSTRVKGRLVSNDARVCRPSNHVGPR